MIVAGARVRELQMSGYDAKLLASYGVAYYKVKTYLLTGL